MLYLAQDVKTAVAELFIRGRFEGISERLLLLDRYSMHEYPQYVSDPPARPAPSRPVARPIGGQPISPSSPAFRPPSRNFRSSSLRDQQQQRFGP
ncbi:hypothetical protein [Mesorhizobium xinjiangense]|uniref:hypothetical protein n=1 Tax=Mesorhizobium xinjiangense TaxID=2678685 RepID=UPI002E252A07